MLHSSSNLTFKKKYLLTLNSSPKIYSVLFSPLNTTAALSIEPSLFALLCHFCNRAKWHPTQETTCPHPGAGTQQAQTDPGLCCPSRRYLGLPFDARPPFPPHCRAAAKASDPLTGSPSWRGQIPLLPCPYSFTHGKNKPRPNVISWITASTKKKKCNFRFDSI